MRAALLTVAAIGCSDAVDPERAPTLPGDEPPTCLLAADRHFLVTSLLIPDGKAFPIDLALPPVHNVNGVNYPFLLTRNFTTKAPAAADRAVMQRHILWVIGLRACTNASEIRMSLRRGVSVSDATTPPTVGLSGDPFSWSVGEVSATSYDASYGRGFTPVGVELDPNAETSETGWAIGHAVSIHATLASPAVLTGSIALGIETEPAIHAISAAIARNLTVSASEHPECPGVNCESPALASVYPLFDVGGDRVFSTSEIEGNPNLRSHFSVVPMLDLLALEDGASVYWPDHDREADSHALSFTFTASVISVVPE